jgi:hypothetical protein
MWGTANSQRRSAAASGECRLPQTVLAIAGCAWIASAPKCPRFENKPAWHSWAWQASWTTTAYSSTPSRIEAASTVVHRPRLSPMADWVISMVRTILFEIR